MVHRERAEADTLRMRIISLEAALEGMHLIREQDMAENESLRELVHILCHCMDLHAKCDDCRLNCSKGELVHDHLCACDGLYKMLRELGIEVD